MARIISGGGKKKKTKQSAPKTVNRGTAQAFQRSRRKSPAGEPSPQMAQALGFMKKKSKPKPKAVKRVMKKTVTRKAPK